MATKQTTPTSPYVVYHVEVVSKRGREFSDSDARDLLAANRARLNESGVLAQLNRSFAILSENGPVNPVIVLDIPRETDPKKTQTNPSAFFAETDRVTVTWREVTQAEQPSPLPEGAADLGKAVGGPTTVVSDLATGGLVDTTVATNVAEGFKNAAG